MAKTHSSVLYGKSWFPNRNGHHEPCFDSDQILWNCVNIISNNPNNYNIDNFIVNTNYYNRVNNNNNRVINNNRIYNNNNRVNNNIYLDNMIIGINNNNMNLKYTSNNINNNGKNNMDNNINDNNLTLSNNVKYSHNTNNNNNMNKNNVVNLSKFYFLALVYSLSLLEKGLNFALAPRKIPMEDVMCDMEFGIRGLPDNVKDTIRKDYVFIPRKAKPPRSNISQDEYNALKSLNQNKDIVILKADKGGLLLSLTGRIIIGKCWIILIIVEAIKNLVGTP